MPQHSWFYAIAVVVGLFTGCMLGAQPSVNGFLGRNVAHPLQASLISFTTGTTLLLVVTVALGEFPPKFLTAPRSMPWWAWTGGAIGTVMVTTSLFFVPRIGSLTWFAVVMTGQVLAALVLDHFGWLGNPKQPTNAWRVVGALMLVGGIACISYSREPAVVKQAGGDEEASASGEAVAQSPHAVEQLAEHMGEES